MRSTVGRLRWLTALPALLLTLEASGQELGRTDTALAVAGRWPEGGCAASVIAGEFLFVANGATLQVLNLAHRDSLFQPEPVAEVRMEMGIVDLEAVRETLYVLMHSRLEVVAVADPLHPASVSSLELPRFPGPGASHLSVELPFVYIAQQWGLLTIVDVSDRTGPFVRSTGVGWYGQASALASWNRLVFAGDAEYPGLTIVDASNPDSLVSQMLYVGEFVRALAERESLLAVASGAQVRLLQLGVSPDPVLLGALPYSERVMDIAMRDSTLFLISRPYDDPYQNRLAAIDIGDRSNPGVRALKPLDLAIPKSLDCTSELVTVAGYNGLSAFRRIPGDSLIADVLYRSPGSSIPGMTFADSQLVCSSVASGVWVVDAPNGRPHTPVLWGRGIEDVAVDSGLCFARNPEGVFILRLRAGSPPESVAMYPTRGPTAVCAGNGNVFVGRSAESASDTILQVVSVAEPGHPALLGVLCGEYRVDDLVVTDGTVYIAAGAAGILIVDVRNPAAPSAVTVLPPRNWRPPGGMALSDEHLFVHWGDSVAAYSVAEPRQPYLVGVTSLGPGLSVGVEVEVDARDGYLVWGHGRYFGVVEISNPSAMQPVVGGWGPGRVGGVATREGVFAISGDPNGVWFLRRIETSVVDEGRSLTGAAPVELANPYPSPFNAHTRIGLTVRRGGALQCELFDALGRRIRVLLDGFLAPGEYVVSLDGTRLASGCYVVRAAMHGFQVSRRVLLVR